jgi:phosphatidyl-myo-inositol dimannoside synthase
MTAPTDLQGRRIVLLTFDLLGSAGGIARHGRTVARALLDAGCSLSIVALNDPAEKAVKARHMFPAAQYEGFGGAKGRFLAAALLQLRARPDLVLLEHPHLAPVGWAVARAGHAHLAIFVHGIDVWSKLSPTRRWPLRQADLVLCVSHTTKQRGIVAGNLARRNSLVLYNCLDPTMRLAPGRRNQRDAPSMLTVSRINADDAYKGHRQVIEAMPTLLTRFPDLTYDIVGDGDDRPELEALAIRLGVDAVVRFHGDVTDDELLACYARASVFIMPSRSEGFGYVFLEAMAHGLPAIGGNLDASAEVIVDGQTGLLIDPGSVNGIVDAATRLLVDPGLRTRMGQAAAQHVERHFTFPHFREDLIHRLAALDSPGSGHTPDHAGADC